MNFQIVTFRNIKFTDIRSSRRHQLFWRTLVKLRWACMKRLTRSLKDWSRSSLLWSGQGWSTTSSGRMRRMVNWLLQIDH